MALRIALKLERVELPAPRPLRLRVFRVSIGGGAKPAGAFASLALPVAVEDMSAAGRRLYPVLDITGVLVAGAAVLALLRLMRLFIRKSGRTPQEVD